MAELDAIDRTLLSLLQANARTPTAVLARKVDLSRSATQERLARLERLGVIAGYTVRFATTPEDGFRAHVFISLDARHAPQLQQAMRVRPEVKRCHTVSGEFDVAILVETEGPKALDRLLDDIGRLPGVRRTQSAVVLDVKFERG
ncbi:Lrp/AsnC family transcriptional regulator [Lacibacterium aquatile]|uniref:Lrp/AsnC family transcriptional regulator n=1 Tax=Lacibacterium aquatile TaxID=1168082 RepID=A0ABW5DNA2_9PROT